jgi:CRP-like cAMP-binding protein
MMSAMPDRVELSSLQIRAISQIAERAFFSTYCIGTHNGSNRLARILLEASDAFGDGRHITLTQQELSDLLLLRRETVSQLLGDWSAHQIVSLRRGSIAIENRAELLAQACSCYSVIKEFERAELELWRSIRWVIPSNLKYA